MQDRPTPIKQGETAPQFTLPTHHGVAYSLAEQLDKPTIIMLMREFTCIQCRNHVAVLVRQYDEIQQAGANVVVMGGGNVRQAKSLADTYKPLFPILADENRDVYHTFGIHHTLFVQRNATMIIDTDGVVRYISESLIPGSSFNYAEVLSAVKKLTAEQSA